MNSYQKVYNEKRAILIEQRTKQEQAFNTWVAKLRNVDKSVFGDLIIPDDMSYETMLPELYKDEPDLSVYKEQVARLENFVTRVNNIVERVNTEALECLRKYKQLN